MADSTPPAVAGTATEPLPCPFCGNTDFDGSLLDKNEGIAYTPLYVIVCPCGAETMGARTVDQAVANWNRRAAPATPAPAAGADSASGPYAAVACRGHYHVTCDGEQILTDAGDCLDEATARAEAAHLNACHHSDTDTLRAEIERLTAALSRATNVNLEFVRQMNAIGQALGLTPPCHDDAIRASIAHLKRLPAATPTPEIEIGSAF